MAMPNDETSLLTDLNNTETALMGRQPNNRQGNLFEAAPVLDTNCSMCGRVIVIVHLNKDGVASEYRDRFGRCYDCARAAGFKAPWEKNG